MIRRGPISLYFHSPCFDGAVSAAIASDYLENVEGYTSVSLVGVNYGSRERWLSERLQPPAAAVVDFLYHPDAVFWADHHPTTFLRDEDAKVVEERISPHLLYDRRATSCALLIWRDWGRELSAFSHHYEPLVKWADRIDSARYTSVEEVLFQEAPALRVNLAIAVSKDPAFTHRLVGLIRKHTADELASIHEIRELAREGQRLQRKGMARLKDSIRLTEEGIAVFDVHCDDVLVNRYAQFHIYPHARYSIGIFRHAGRSKLTAMRNPWLEFASAPIGELCAPFGGGGHHRVGSIELAGRDPDQVLTRFLSAMTSWEREHASAPSR